MAVLMDSVSLAEDGTGALGLFRISLREKAEPFQIARAMMVRNLAVSPRGDEVAVLTPSGKIMMYSTRSHEPGSGLKIPDQFAPLKWSSDGKSLFVQDLRMASVLPSSVYRFELASAKLRPWNRIAPLDRTGVNAVTGVVIAEDEQHYAYSYRRVLSELFAVQGLQ